MGVGDNVGALAHAKKGVGVKELINAVVGSGIPDYFSNCVQSILELSTHDVVAYYNWVDERDRLGGETVAKRFRSENVTFVFHPNEPSLRTGSLYRSYNNALQLAQGRYRYLSYIQADMQMMFWDERIIEECDSRRTRHTLENGGDLCFYTQIPVMGKREDFYSIWQDVGGTINRSLPGAVDVGIYPVESAVLNHLKFEGSEKEFSHHASKMGFSTSMHPFPFLAAIPFPHTSRDRTKVGHGAVREAREDAILVLSPQFEAKKDFTRGSFHPFFMEDSVWPNGWSALTPYWPSDTNGSSWIRHRLAHSFLTGESFLSVQEGPKYRSFSFRRFRPGYLAVFRALLRFGFREFNLWTLRKGWRPWSSQNYRRP